jgi:hypothetical protein
MTALLHRKCPDCSTWMDGAWDAVYDHDKFRCPACNLTMIQDCISKRILQIARITGGLRSPSPAV